MNITSTCLLPDVCLKHSPEAEVYCDGATWDDFRCYPDELLGRDRHESDTAELNEVSMPDSLEPEQTEGAEEQINGLSLNQRKSLLEHEAQFLEPAHISHVQQQVDTPDSEPPEIATCSHENTLTANNEDPSLAAVLQPEAVYADPNWKSRLSVTTRGQIRPSLGNIIIAFEYAPPWHGAFRYDEFGDSIIAATAMPHIPRDSQITDHEISLTTAELQKHDLHVASALVWEAARTVAKCHAFHPVKEYLNGLVHDGKPRLDEWLITYAGAEPSDYSRAVGRLWLISAVARIFKPGCKADCCLILEGPEGYGKSTAFSILGGIWFCDGITDIRGKDALIKMRGKWIIELAELAGLGRAKSEQIKAFMSTAKDRYRPVYERAAVDSPRQCIYAGTTNHSNYFEDVTGQRRFWPVRTSKIDNLRLSHDRDQLFAEAVARFKHGALWYLDTPELVAEAEKHQADRLVVDPWQERIAEYCEHHEIVFSPEILDQCIGKLLGQQTQSDVKRVAHCLKVVGLEAFKTSSRPRVTGYRWPSK